MAKRRTAKQKAATRKLVAMNKRKRKGTTKGMRRKTARRAFEGLRKRTTRRRKSTTLKTRTRRRSMARKGLKSLTSGSTIKKVALGLGGAAMATAIVAAVAPQFGRVAGPAGAYALGGLEGVIGNFAFDFVKGRMANGTTAQNAAPAMEVL